MSELRKLLDLIPVRGDLKAPDRPARQRCRRLRPDELHTLISGYEAGVEVRVLAEEHQITRQTVSELMRRHGVTRRVAKLGSDAIEVAESRYQSGDSLATVGALLGVDPGTVRRAVVRVGVPIRDAHGRDRSA